MQLPGRGQSRKCWKHIPGSQELYRSHSLLYLKQPPPQVVHAFKRYRVWESLEYLTPSQLGGCAHTHVQRHVSDMPSPCTTCHRDGAESFQLQLQTCPRPSSEGEDTRAIWLPMEVGLEEPRAEAGTSARGARCCRAPPESKLDR